MTTRKFKEITLTLLASASLLASCGGITGEEATTSATTVTLSGYASGTSLSKPSTADGPSMAAVQGAVVQLLTLDGILVATTTTDSNGRYTVDVTAGQNYIVRVSKGNVVLKALVVTPGTNTTVNITPHSSAVVRVMADNLGNSNLGEVNVDVSVQVDLINLDALITAIVSNTDFDNLVAAIENEILVDGDYEDDSGDTVGNGGNYPNITIIIIIVIGGDGGSDTTPPDAPIVTGSTPTSDTTPTWNWTSGGGGIGTYRYKQDDSDLTSGATYTVELSHTPLSPLADGDHTLYVQERDAAGNWSESGSTTITIDTTALHGWTTKAPMPNVRYLSQKVVVSGIVYFIGGRDANGTIDSVEAYDPTTDTWTTKASMPVAIGSSPWAEVVNGIIYVIGSGQASSDPILVYAYDTTADTWSEKASVPTTRNFFSVGQSNGLIYTIGGTRWCGAYCSSGIVENVIEAYNPTTDSWSTVVHTGTVNPGNAIGPVLSTGDIIVTSSGYCGRNLSYFDTSTNHLYNIPALSSGGVTWCNTAGIFSISNQVYMLMARGPIAQLDQGNNTWINLVMPPTPRGEPEAVLFNNEIFSLGGYTSGAPGIDSTIVEAYDPVTNSWSTKPPLLEPKFISSNGLSLNGMIYIFGGIDRAAGWTYLKTVEAYQ